MIIIYLTSEERNLLYHLSTSLTLVSAFFDVYCAICTLSIVQVIAILNIQKIFNSRIDIGGKNKKIQSFY